jgi:hypothetical protein
MPEVPLKLLRAGVAGLSLRGHKSPHRRGFYDTAEQLAEKVAVCSESIPQRLKSDALQSIQVRADARCGEVGPYPSEHEFFCKL